MPREIYKNYVSPVLDHLDSETMHVAAREAFHSAELTPFTLQLVERIAGNYPRFTDEKLRVVIGGIELENPLIVGAGWDKKGHSVRSLYHLGFAGVEIPVVAFPQAGNPKPRQEVKNGVSRNWLGLNSPGMEAIAKNLDRYKEDEIPIIINVARNNDKTLKERKVTLSTPELYSMTIEKMYKYASAIVYGVSTPNTPGAREQQKQNQLEDIVQAGNQTMRKIGEIKPSFVKVDPDSPIEVLDGVIRVVIDNGLTGIVATNTTIDPEIKAKYGWADKPGGVSGADPDFRRKSTERIRHIYKETKGQVEIIGAGSIFDTDSALEKLRAGAKVLAIVTGIRSEGPRVATNTNRGLVEYMDREGVKHISDIVGTAVR